MMRGASHVGGVVASCAVLVCSGLFPSVVSMVGVSSGSGAGSSCGCSQGASLRVVPSARRAVCGVPVARLVLVGAMSFAAAVGVAVGAGGIAPALLSSVFSLAMLLSVLDALLFALSSSAPPLAAYALLAFGVVSCPVSPRAMVWSAAACSWMARLARSMSARARVLACASASAMICSASARASVTICSASARAFSMMVPACSRACWMALSMAAVIPSSGLAACVVSVLFTLSFPFAVALLFLRVGCRACLCCVRVRRRTW